MRQPVKTLVWGLTDPGQACDVGRMGVDGVVLAVGGEGPLALAPGAASEVAAALPPLTARLAAIPPTIPLPAGFTGAVTRPTDPRPAGAAIRLVRVRADLTDLGRVPSDAEGVWTPPGEGGTSSATRFDFARLDGFRGARALILEIPDGPIGVETAIRLGRPYAVLLGESVWFRPGILDLDLLERSLSVVARMNKIAFEI